MHILKIEHSRSNYLGKRKKREIKIKISMDMNGNTVSYSISTVPKNIIKTDTLHFIENRLRKFISEIFTQQLLDSWVLC